MIRNFIPSSSLNILNSALKKAAFLIGTAGFSSLIIQVVLIRECLISLKGNELHIGFIMAMWLLAGSLGSFTGAWTFRSKKDQAVLGSLMVTIAAAASASFLLVRSMRLSFPIQTYVPGAGVSVLWITAAVFPSAFLFGCLNGRILSGRKGEAAASLYYAETLGIAAAGITASFILIPWTGSSAAVLFAASLCAVCGFSCFL